MSKIAHFDNKKKSMFQEFNKPIPIYKTNNKSSDESKMEEDSLIELKEVESEKSSEVNIKSIIKHNEIEISSYLDSYVEDSPLINAIKNSSLKSITNNTVQSTQNLLPSNPSIQIHNISNYNLNLPAEKQNSYKIFNFTYDKFKHTYVCNSNPKNYEISHNEIYIAASEVKKFPPRKLKMIVESKFSIGSDPELHCNNLHKRGRGFKFNSVIYDKLEALIEEGQIVKKHSVQNGKFADIISNKTNFFRQVAPKLSYNKLKHNTVHFKKSLGENPNEIKTVKNNESPLHRDSKKIQNLKEPSKTI